jgi:hypothetical protein
MSVGVTDLKPYILPPMNHFKCIPNLLTSKQVRSLWIGIRQWTMHPHPYMIVTVVTTCYNKQA